MRIKKTIGSGKKEVAELEKGKNTPAKVSTSTTESDGQKVIAVSTRKSKEIAKKVNSDSSNNKSAKKSSATLETGKSNDKKLNEKSNELQQGKDSTNVVAQKQENKSDEKLNKKNKVSEQKNAKECKETTTTTATNTTDKNKKSVAGTKIATGSKTQLKRKINTADNKDKKNKLKNQKKISNELKNLGIDILLDGPKGFGLKQATAGEDCKTSICEMVKTKSRSSVSPANYVPFMKINKAKSSNKVEKTDNNKTEASDVKSKQASEENTATSDIMQASSSEKSTIVAKTDIVDIKKSEISEIKTGDKEENKVKLDSGKKSNKVEQKKATGQKTSNTSQTPPISPKKSVQKKNDEQIDSLIKQGPIKKVTSKKNNKNVKESIEKDDKSLKETLPNSETNESTNKKQEKEGVLEEPLKKPEPTKVKRKYVRKNVPKQATKSPDPKKSESTKKNDDMEKNISIDTKTCCSSSSSKDVYDFPDNNPQSPTTSTLIRPLFRREPIFKHKAKMRELQQKQQGDGDTSPSVETTKANSETNTIKSQTPTQDFDKTESELAIEKQEYVNEALMTTPSDKDTLDKKSIPEKSQKSNDKSSTKNEKKTTTANDKKQSVKSKEKKVKSETESDSEPEEKKTKAKSNLTKVAKKSKQIKKVIKKVLKRRATIVKKAKIVSEESEEDSDSSASVVTRIQKRRAAKNRHMKKYGFWSGPKRHREASLNALAKVHCLYENESRSALEQNLIKAAKLESLKDLEKFQIAKEKKEKIAKKLQKEKVSSDDTESESEDTENEDDKNKEQNTRLVYSNKKYKKLLR